jgi:N-acetyl-1-D-myo-inositol-2-amino-2-deoxy-alpha-D-glucopyranoside deacetylase
MRLKLLAVHAHPDDESIGTGGTLALYSRKGVHVALVCATRGEEGELQGVDPSQDPAELRSKELEAACKVLGVSDLRFLGYRDSGMAGTAANGHPRAFCNAEPAEASRRLASILREVRPQVVITYNERGFYGHPDHVAANRITNLALGEAQKPGPKGEAPWNVPRLFYTAAPRSRLIKLEAALKEAGKGGLPYPVETLATPDDEITAWIDVREVLQVKMEAIWCHKSQLGPKSLLFRLPPRLYQEFFGTECYVWANGNTGMREKITDLFWGLE